MNLKPLEKIKIWNLRNYAETNIQRFEDISEKGLTKQKDDINFCCKVKSLKIYFVLYTQKDSYLVRHIYIAKGRSYPSPEQVNKVLKEFGFKGQIIEGEANSLVVSVDDQRYALSISELM